MIFLASGYSTIPPVQWVSGAFPRGKADGAWHYHPSPSSTEDKQRVESYLYPTSGPSGQLQCELHLDMVVLRLSPGLECSLCSFGNFPGV